MFRSIYLDRCIDLYIVPSSLTERFAAADRAYLGGRVGHRRAQGVQVVRRRDRRPAATPQQPPLGLLHPTADLHAVAGHRKLPQLPAGHGARLVYITL